MKTKGDHKHLLDSEMIYIFHDPKKRILATDKHGFTQINNALDQFF